MRHLARVLPVWMEIALNSAWPLRDRNSCRDGTCPRVTDFAAGERSAFVNAGAGNVGDPNWTLRLG